MALKNFPISKKLNTTLDGLKIPLQRQVIKNSTLNTHKKPMKSWLGTCLGKMQSLDILIKIKKENREFGCILGKVLMPFLHLGENYVSLRQGPLFP